MFKYALALAGLVLSGALLSCASEPSSEVCSSGIVCPAPLKCAAVQAVCISNLCGNGVVDPGEVCDDGNIMNGDGCSSDCKSKEACGNGIVDPGEVCDDGNTVNGQCGGSAGSGCNEDSDCGTGVKCIADMCSNDCKSRQTCGNGIVDFDEVCDDGNTTNGTCGDGSPCDTDLDCAGIGSAYCTVDMCSSTCESNQTCGNGIVDLNEVCDNGSANAVGAACEPGCLSGSGCGNGVLDPGETCDDGNLIDDDDCPSGSDLPPSERCQIARCGDGIVDGSGSNVHLHEECDPGSAGETATCNANCTTPKCGDSIVNQLYKPDGVHGEQCDNGSANSNNADCTSVCLINVCGDGDHDTIGPNHIEQCDDGTSNGSSTDMCDTTCNTVSCGNGIVEQNEQCDLGAGKNGSNSSCPFCEVAVCGDGYVETGVEQCDLGAGKNGSNSACPSCQKARCGDGLTETGVETCDDGSNNGKLGDTCDSVCQTVRCGNGIVEQGEQCDSSGTDTAQCNGSACTFAICGDGLKNAAAGEACDDGIKNGTVGDPCDSQCQLVTCGNGILEQGEQCDGSAFEGNATCASLGDGGGTLKCTGCKFDTSACTPVCGDNKIEDGEECDGSKLGSGTCTSLGYDGGTLSCGSNCQYNVSACISQVCPNGKAEGTEQCDGSDFRGLTCSSLGFDGDANSELLCGATTCLLDTSMCNDCKDGVKDDGETGSDCGGPCVATCSTGEGCNTGSDCTSTFCISGECGCGSNADCAPEYCNEQANTCIADHCADHHQDGGESDIDCGGPDCSGCIDGKQCGSNGDCMNLDCGSGGTNGICGT
jgi:cysteine-rich repeat protein